MTVAVVLAPACTLTGDGATDTPMAGAVDVNVAVTEVPKSFGVSVQVSAVPTHDPDQLVKALPVAGAAVRVTCVSASNSVVQTLPQLMPAGVDVTVPDPEPALTTATPGRAFFTVRLSDGHGPSVCSVSLPTSATKYGVLDAMSASLAAVSVTTVEETPGASDGGSYVAVTPRLKTGTTMVTVPCAPLPLRERVRVAVALFP